MKNYKKIKNITFWISTLMWLGTCAFLVLFGYFTKWNVSANISTETAVVSYTEQLAASAKAIFGTLIVSLGIGVLLTIFLKEKTRNTFWMANEILSVYIFGTTGMFVILALWAIDEFIIHKIYEINKSRVFILETVNGQKANTNN